MAFPNAFAQFNEKPVLNKESIDEPFLNWGYYLGFNQYDFKFEYNNNRGDDTDILVKKSLGFNVGLIGEMRLHEFLDVRAEPGLSYTLRTLGFPGFTEERDAVRDVKSTYINFPLLLKINTRRFGNWKP
ncbi:MAG: porin family protein, partial [Flavobacteriaceae bacterium]